MALDPRTPTMGVVFGATGFIGRYVVNRMARCGWRVRVPCRNPDKALFLKPFGEPGQVSPVLANIRDDATVAAAVAGADIVVNLVGILAESGKNTFDAVHRQSAERIAKAAAAAGVGRLIQISAIGADPNSPSAYARTKAEGEQAVLAAFPDATILRPSIVVGPEDDFFNRFAGMARFSPVLPLIGGGESRFQPVYVGDVAEAAIHCATTPETKGQTFELGGPSVYTFADLMRLLMDGIQRRRALVTVPWGMARFQAKILQQLPNPPLTTDQLLMLERDNVVSDDAKTLADLGLQATPIESILPTYLWQYRLGGRFARPSSAT